MNDHVPTVEHILHSMMVEYLTVKGVRAYGAELHFSDGVDMDGTVSLMMSNERMAQRVASDIQDAQRSLFGEYTHELLYNLANRVRDMSYRHDDAAKNDATGKERAFADELLLLADNITKASFQRSGETARRETLQKKIDAVIVADAAKNN